MIYTSAPRIKEGSQWCDRADAIALAFHDELGFEYGDEIPYEKMLPEIGLADTLVALGAPHPRCKPVVEKLLHTYLLKVYDVAKELCDRLGVDFVDLKNIINVPNRQAQAKQLSSTLRHLQYTTYDPILDNLFFAMRMLLSEESNSIKAVFAGKRVLAAWKLADSDEDVYNELYNYLLNLLGQ